MTVLRLSAYYDDNFGHWGDESDDPEERETFRRHVERSSVEKKCQGCGRMVRIMPQYAYCDSCATKIERGEDVGCHDE